MTCIVGLVQDGKVYVGGDSGCFEDWSLTIESAPKVFRNGEFLFGVAGLARFGQVLRYGFTPPEHPAGMDDLEYLTTSFAKAVREAGKDTAIEEVKDSRPRIDAELVIGYRGRVYRMNCDSYYIFSPSDPYVAAGCAGDIALGVLYATEGLPARERVMRALEAAEHFSGGVRAPFHIEVLS